MLLAKNLHLPNTIFILLIITTIGSLSIFAEKLAVQSDGRIVVVGIGYNGSNGDFAVRRFDVYGNPDLSFGTGGRVLTNIGISDESAEAVLIQPDGKIVVAGWTRNFTSTSAYRYDFAVVRYNPNGTLDLTFDGDGIVVTNFASYNSFAFAVTYRSIDQKIIVSGTVSYSPYNNDFATIRYNSNGSPDSTFGFFGRKISSAPGAEVAESVATDSLGRVYVGGRDAAIVRYNSNGSDDTTFAFDGVYEMSEPFQAMALDSRSRVVGATGYTYGSRQYFKVFRLNSAGALDDTFGFGGIKISDINGLPNALTIHPDQRITVVGGTGRNIVLVRYTYYGAQDNTFGSGGIVIDSVPSGLTFVNSIAYYPIGSKTIVLFNGPDGRVALTRYNYDGSRDRLFSGDGVLTFSF